MAGWIVKYDGPCAKCGTTLHAGEPAVWIREARRMECIECPTPVAPDSPPPLDAGVAGCSARAEYDRRSTKRITEIDKKWGRFGGIVKALTVEPQSTRAWAIGAAGEEELARRLAEVDGLQVLNDRSVPRSKSNIDHIVIAPAGVFVVDAKHLVGTIEIRNVGPFWRSDDRLFVGRRDKSKLADNLDWQIEAVRAALTTAGVDPLPPITPVLCFIDGDWPMFRPPEAFHGVRLEGPKSIKKLVTASNVLDAGEIEGLARILSVGVPAK